MVSTLHINKFGEVKGKLEEMHLNDMRDKDSDFFPFQDK